MKEFILTNAEATAVDRYAIETTGIPGIELMGKAGHFIALRAKKMLKDVPNSRVDIFCGTGNNGGDGFAAALDLFDWGANTVVWLVGEQERIKGDARHYFDQCVAKNIPIRAITEQAGISPELRQVSETDLIIDALLGTGFRGTIHGILSEVIKLINNSRQPVIAVDIPSGVDGDTGQVKSVAVQATVTVTMGFLKRGLLFYPGKHLAGEIVVVDLDYPAKAFNTLTQETFLISKADVKRVIPPVMEDTYKHRQGKILIFAGSVGMTGAACLCAQAAMRTGAGLVVAAIPRSLYPIIAAKLTEVLALPVSESAEQTFCPEAISEATGRIDWSDIVVFGPGVGAHPAVMAFGQELIKICPKPLIIDADGLRIFKGQLDLIRRIPDAILTPHHGEFALMTGWATDDIRSNPIDWARQFVQDYPCTLVLKGAPTIVVSRHGQVAVNPSGNPGLSTGGTGDVLTGIIATFRAQGMGSFEAAYAGVAIHGLAGDWARKKLGVRSLIASDLFDYLPLILRRIEKVI